MTIMTDNNGNQTKSVIKSGLEGVVVADTVLSDVDGEKGRLVLYGHDIEALVGRVTFEDACGLLWQGRLPSATEREGIRADLGRARAEAFERLPRLGDALSAEDGMDALRAALGHLPSGLPLSSAGLSSPSAAAPADAAAWTPTWSR
jgi:citrate synthase